MPCVEEPGIDDSFKQAYGVGQPFELRGRGAGPLVSSGGIRDVCILNSRTCT